MTTTTKALTRTAIATAAAGAVALASASPAAARDRYDRNEIDAGDIIAGALIIGGIAAVAGVFDGDDDRRYRDRDYRDRRYNDRWDNRYDRRYNQRGNAQSAISQCVNAVERDARRAGYRYADVTEIRDVDRQRYGFKVKGRLQVDGARYDRRGGWNTRRDRYDNRRSYDRGSFTCRVDRGRVIDLDIDGVRGLR